MILCNTVVVNNMILWNFFYIGHNKKNTNLSSEMKHKNLNTQRGQLPNIYVCHVTKTGRE